MTKAPWREAVRAYIQSEALPVDKYGHQPRLYALASEIAIGQECDDDVLFAAAWMHDLGVFVGHRPADPAALAAWDHVPYTIRRSRELLLEWGFPSGKVDAVAEAIRSHQPKDEPLIAEAVVLRDADILEQLGAVGTLRAFVKVGRDTRFQRFSDVVPVLDRALRELPGKLRLARSKQLSEGRIAVLRDFLNALRMETDEMLF